MINPQRLVDTFTYLAQIDSPSGEEEAMAIELTKRLKGLGFEVIRDHYGNLIASEGGDNPIMLSGHMDTVEPGRNINPIIDGDRIVSDGTTIVGGDAKAGIASILEALESLKEDRVARIPVEVVLTREEELALLGARELDFSMINSKEAVVFDSEGPVSRITSSSPTYIGIDVEIRGRAAHAGVEPEKGLSAIRVAADLISNLPQGRLDNETTFNIGTITGGNVRNTVPDEASLRGEFRSMNLETVDSLRLQVGEVVTKIQQIYPDVKIEDHLHTDFETYSVKDNEPALLRVKSTLQEIGLKPSMKPSGGGTDGNIFRLNRINAVVVGMAVYNMHTLSEHIEIPELVDVAHFCESLLRK